MNMKNGVWRDAQLDLPDDGVQVLCVKETKAGVRSLCFGAHWNGRQWDNGWVTGGGCNNVIYWMGLPEVPKKGETKNG